MTWQGDTYYGPMCNPDGVVTYLDLAEWAQITLTEAEERFGSAVGPERMRIAGEDCFWVRDILHFLEIPTPTDQDAPPAFWSGRREAVARCR